MPTSSAVNRLKRRELLDRFAAAKNRDFTGKPIMPSENQYGPQEPDHKRYWGNVGPHWKAITDFLADATGGDDVTPGAIDVSPETLEYLSGTAIGSAGAFANRMFSIPFKAVDPDVDLTANDIPLARKVVGQKPSWYDKSAFYDRLGQVEQQIAYAKGYLDEGDRAKAREYVLGNRDIFTLEADAKAARRDMRKVRKAKREVTGAHERGQLSDSQFQTGNERISAAEKVVIQRFNKRWNEVMTGGSGE